MLRVLISAWPHFLAKHEGRATSQMMAEVAARVETMLLTHGNRQGAARKRRELFGGEGEEVRRIKEISNTAGRVSIRRTHSRT